MILSGRVIASEAIEGEENLCSAKLTACSRSAVGFFHLEYVYFLSLSHPWIISIYMTIG